MQTADSRLLVCTSPSFNSKCRHPDIACLDWDNVKLSPAQGSQPDSGVDNTEDQEQEKRAMVEKWSEDAARHTGEWTEEINGEFIVYSEFLFYIYEFVGLSKLDLLAAQLYN